ncbi:MAG: DUF547 domain-containing protein [Myxococcota bacterium]
MMIKTLRRTLQNKITGHTSLVSRLSSGLALTFTLAGALGMSGPAWAGQNGSPVDLGEYGELLSTHTYATQDIVGTRVDYKALTRSAELKSLVRQVETAKPSTLDRNEKLAFWINAYNLLAIDLIVKNYPVDSIKDIGSFFSPVWDLEVATIEGKSVSLGGIEHEILRKMGEPRIHAAIICASTSCPPLARSPFSPATLNADLDGAMKSWLTSEEKGIAINRSARTVRLSKIFDWFEEDFESKGGVLQSVTPYLDASDAAWLAQNGRSATISYFGYDWSLNDRLRAR